MRTLPLLLNLTTLLLCISTISAAPNPPLNVLIPSDAAPLLSFKLKADLDNRLLYTLNERFDYCQWQGVKCAQGRVVRFVLESYGLRGTFPANTLTRLDQLRILSLSNNSLSGPLPDLSSLINLKSLFLNQNNFWGSFPPSVLLLHRLRVLDLSFNNFSGNIPVQVNSLSRLTSLELEFNSLSGSVPPLNITTLAVFNVSGNGLTGQVPVTATLSRFGPSSFRLNPSLCGEIVNKDCHSSSPFFDSTTTTPPPKLSPQIQGTVQSEGIGLSPPSSSRHHSRIGIVTLGFITGVVVLLLLALVILFLVRKKSNHSHGNEGKREGLSGSLENNNATISSVVENQPELQKSNELVNNAGIVSIKQLTKSGSLVFCEGETRAYTLEQLMRGSAELLGRGTIGTTYKAVLDNHLILTVKRLDAGKTGITSAEVFNGHMEIVGGLRHPNLVPVRAYFQAKEERLIIYDYQANGSLFNLIHGSRSTRAKPLHWTSCLKIADDVAQGLAYIHQASGLVHGNLKSSNVLLGSDFEACITDYSLAILADASSSNDPDSAAYRAPETRKSSCRATPKSDVYAFGVLLLELLTGKHPSQHPFLVPTDIPEWVRAMRDEDSEEDNHLTMLVEIASICSITSPEQRPTMWQVLKMIQEIKESAMLEDSMVNANRHHL